MNPVCDDRHCVFLRRQEPSVTGGSTGNPGLLRPQEHGSGREA